MHNLFDLSSKNNFLRLFRWIKIETHFPLEGRKPLTIITKRSILDVAAVLDPPLKPIPLFYLNPHKVV